MNEKMTEIGFEKEYTMTDVAFSAPSYLAMSAIVQ